MDINKSIFCIYSLHEVTAVFSDEWGEILANQSCKNEFKINFWISVWFTLLEVFLLRVLYDMLLWLVVLETDNERK